MLEKYFTQLEASLKAKLEAKATARRKFVYEIARIGTRIFDDNWSIGWTTVFVPYEILTSMGVSGMFVEFFGAMLAGTGMSSKYLELSESKGFSTDSCSYHRTIIGAALDGLLPEPDVLIGASIPCNGGVKALKRIGEIFNKEVFILNIPIDITPKSVDYLTEQFEQMIEYIENETGRKLDYNKLKNSIRYNNEAREYLVELNKLCMNVPSPANSNDLKNFIMIVLLLGTKESVEVAKLYRDEFKSRIEHDLKGATEEKYRLMWIQNRIQFKTDILSILEEKYGAKIVIDELNHIWWDSMDESDPLRSLAKRIITHPLVGPAERRLEVITQLARDYKIDGAINPAHWGCRQSAGARVLFKDALQKIGIPLIHLDVDCVDERNYAQGQIMTRLEAFLEMLSTY
ncbi:MAG: 2-hydroxyacyl-CoA dehydratase [Candidatus Lokiarchaeota archaeon]|nr:2-hydroxyacyl-CoA dehydratase [Candidatus Lokiarchaeota archaeon]